MSRFRRRLEFSYKNINLILSEGDLPKTVRKSSNNIVFEPIKQILNPTVSNCVIVPGTRLYNTETLTDFCGSVGEENLKLTGNNKLDCETFYFLKDYNESGNDVATDLASGALWAYTFTGWHIKNTPISSASSTYIKNGQYIPAQSVFQPGDVITKEVLVDYGILDKDGNTTGNDLELEALWGKCYFVSSSGGNTNGNAITKPMSFTYAYKVQGTTPKYAFDVVYMLISDVTYTLFSSKNVGFTLKSLQSTYSNGTYTYQDGQKYKFIQTSGGDTHYAFRFRLDNVICDRTCLSTVYYYFSVSDGTIPLYLERTARNEGYLGTYSTNVKTLFVLNGGRQKSAEWIGWNTTPTYNMDIFVGRNCYFSSPLYVGMSCLDSDSSKYIWSSQYTTTLTITGGEFDDYIALQSTKGTYYNTLKLNIYGNGLSSSEYNPKIKELFASKSLPIGGDVYFYINGCSNITNIYGGGGDYTAIAAKTVNLQIYNSKVQGNVHVGGKYAGLTGEAYLDMKNCTVYGNLYGSSMASTSVAQSVYSFSSSVTETTTTPHNDVKNPPSGFPTYNKSNYTVLMYKAAYVSWWSFEGSGKYNISVNNYTAKLANATAKNISVNIENSIIGDKTEATGSTGNIYGGGLDSIISGDTSIVVKNTTVYGSIYGGGNGAAQPDSFKLCPVLSTSEYTAPTTKAFYDNYLADNTYLFEYQSPNPLTDDTYGEYYNWSNDSAVLTMGGIDSVNKLVYSNNFSNWGNVNGSATLTIIGGTIKGSVYAGGNTANIGGSTILTISDKCTVDGSVIGSGDNGTTDGDSTINVSNSHIKGNLYRVNDNATVSGTRTLNIDENSVVDGEIKLN